MKNLEERLEVKLQEAIQMEVLCRNNYLNPPENSLPIIWAIGVDQWKFLKEQLTLILMTQDKYKKLN